MDFSENENNVVITNWDSMKECMFARKCWVNPSDVDTEKDYEKGDFLRVYCDHDGCWCSAELGVDCCAIYQDHKAE